MERAASVNPAILEWARKSAGLSLESAAKRLSLGDGTALSAAEKLGEMERGERFPTRTQLAKFALVYHRPLITFYMKDPPHQASNGEDFRMLSGDVPMREQGLLDALLRDIRARQAMVKGLLEDEDEAVASSFVGSARLEDGVAAVAAKMSAALNFNPGTRRTGTPDDLFRVLRRGAEAIGVFVLLAGDLGSHHNKISERAFRGFAIADPVAPFVVINDQDATAARSFTLIHELAHIWLGQTGVSGGDDRGEEVPRTRDSRVEAFCNDVAGALLLPDQSLLPRPEGVDGEDVASVVLVAARIAQTWRVSETMVAYRMWRLGWISRRVYSELSALYAARWQASKARNRADKSEQEGAPSYYTVRQFKLGNALLGIVHRNVRSKLLTHTKAAKVLGVRPGSVEPLLKRYESLRGATAAS